VIFESLGHSRTKRKVEPRKSPRYVENYDAAFLAEPRLYKGRRRTGIHAPAYLEEASMGRNNKDGKRAASRASNMTDNDLLEFNPIIFAAFGKFVSENDGEAIEMVKPILASAIKIGVDPALIYATIKTQRLVTEENIKLLSREDLQEWTGAIEEYEQLAQNRA
jgi:hypothetical protein